MESKYGRKKNFYKKLGNKRKGDPKLKIIALVICLSIFLTGCLPLNNLHPQEEKQTKKSEETVEFFKTPEIKTYEKYYRTLLVNKDNEVQFSPGEARGEITGGPSNRIDIDELELGLMRLAQDTFSVDNYFYQAGQYIDRQTIKNWLYRKNDKPVKVDSPFPQEGFNPALPKNYDSLTWEKKLEQEQKNPKELSYVLEQNYLVEQDGKSPKLAGMTIGLSFNPTYYYRVMDSQGKLHDGQVALDLKKLRKDAEKIGEEVVGRLRQNPKLLNIPIVIGLYLEEAKGSVVPGHYFAKTVVDKGDASVGKWEDVQEKYYFFPSKGANADKREDSSTFNLFKTKVQEFYPDFVSVIGKGFYQNNQLSRLTIEIPIQFKGKAEIISFTQFLTHLVKDIYPNEVVRVYVYSSMNKPESIIISNPNEDEPQVHIFR